MHAPMPTQRRRFQEALSVCPSPPSKPSFQLSRQWSHHHLGTRSHNPGRVQRRCHEHVVTLIANKSLNALQVAMAFSTLFVACMGGSIGWPRPTCVQCCIFAEASEVTDAALMEKGSMNGWSAARTQNFVTGTLSPLASN